MQLLRTHRRISLLTLVVGVFAIACGGHLTTQEAYALCEDLSKDTPISDDGLKACVACYERCDDCNLVSIDVFKCPDEISEAGEGGSEE
jgi:hypothetical protein